MKRNVIEIFSALVLAAAAAPAAVSTTEAEALIREAAQLEKADGCEAAYLKYKEAEGKLSVRADKGRGAQLQGVVANKLDKLEGCYKSCQPNDRQKELLGIARESVEPEPHRATKILRQLLVGRSVDRCTFWSEARTLLRTLPGQADSLDQDQADPCAISPELKKALTDAREAVRKQRSAIADLNYERSRLPGKMGDLADLLRGMDQTRMLLVDLREGLLECDSMNKDLGQQATALKESFGLAQEMALSTYKDQLAQVGRKMRTAQAQLAAKDELLNGQIAEQEKLKKQLEGLSGISEELYNDLFALSQAESVSFSVQVEGRRVEQPIEEMRALLGNEKKVMEVLTAKYPEYFKDGVNLEGLKRKKLVLEKLQQMMKRYGSRPDQRLGYSRALAELSATVEMMDRAIGSAEPKDKVAAAAPEKDDKGSSGVMPWFLGGGGLLAVAGLTALRVRSANKS